MTNSLRMPPETGTNLTDFPPSRLMLDELTLAGTGFQPPDSAQSFVPPSKPLLKISAAETCVVTHAVLNSIAINVLLKEFCIVVVFMFIF